MSPRARIPGLVGHAVVPDFHVAVARSARAELAGSPVIVGGDPAKRGRVVGATSDLRRLGIEPGMGVAEALARVPSARWVRTDLARAREVSGQLRALVRREIGAVETAGLAGFYFRAPDDAGQARARGERLVAVVEAELGLALRVGIAPTRFAAALVAEDVGARGVAVLPPAGFETYLLGLGVERLPTVGPKTTSRLLELGVQDVAGLRLLGVERLELLLGSAGRALWLLANAEDPTPLRVREHPTTLSREEKLPVSGASSVDAVFARLATRLETALRRDGLGASRIALRLATADARTLTRSRALCPPAVSAGDVAAAARDLFERAGIDPGALRRIGIVLKGLEVAGAEDRQLDLF